MQKIQLIEKQKKINIDKYMENKKYIKSLNINMQKLLSLKQIAIKYQS